MKVWQIGHGTDRQPVEALNERIYLCIARAGRYRLKNGLLSWMGEERPEGCANLNAAYPRLYLDQENLLC